MEETKVCVKCKQKTTINNFYQHDYQQENEEHYFYIKEHYVCSQCKWCIQKQYDPNNEETFMWVLKELNCVYDKEYYQKLLKMYLNNSNKILGKYIALMNLRYWACFRFEDSDDLNQAKEFYNARMELKSQGYDIKEIMQIENQFDTAQQMLQYFKDKKKLNKYNLL